MIMHFTKKPFGLALVLLAAIVGIRAAAAQDFLNQDWILDPSRSHVYMQTEKLQGVIEKHQFTSVEGNIDRNGQATVRIDLNTIDTGIDLRNVRMRFLLFETYKFPYAEITATLDKSKLQELATRSRITYPLTVRVNMHGLVREFETPVSVARISPTRMEVATINPINVTGENFDFTKGLGKLADAVGGIRIVPESPVSFDLVFGTGSLTPELEAARASREKSRAEQEVRAIPADECETRFTVISEAQAIYFKTGSAELDKTSEPMLDNAADIAKRCPSVKFDVEGHTDSVGTKVFNQRLSEQRAQSVVDYLTGKGTSAARIQSAGYGDIHPAAPNNNEANRSKNRRIEFKVKKN
jgi:outer membrane protein OmpA-like peptidoglycan-associated protein/polyisoprenoid-binding protein YceI